MKSYLLVALVAAVSGIEARADVSFSITKSNSSALTNSSSITRQADRTWDFTTLAGYDPSLILDFITVTEDFANISGTQVNSTIIDSTTTPITSAAAIIAIFAMQTTPATKTVTLTNGLGGFTAADISGGGEIGQFRTRVALDTGSAVTLSDMTITLDFLTPEPATFGMIGLGLAGLGLIARRRRRA